MVSARLATWMYLLVCILIVLETVGVDVTNTILQNAEAKGAVCLDGSPPAYALHKGVGEAENNWLIFLEGGGWCASDIECLNRTTKDVGSSKRWQQEKSSLVAILSDQKNENPYFYNWTRVYVRYCDGSSYVGDREKPYVDNNVSVYFRGARVFNAVMEDLLAQGMKNASEALITGSSAGGLGALLQCDNFRSLLSQSAKVKCISDAGYFIDGTDIYGGNFHREHFAQVVQTHESYNNLPKSCTSKMNANLCMLPQNFVAQIQAPVFVINSIYDTWQIANILMPKKMDQQDIYNGFSPCSHDIENCNCDQVKHWRGFQEQFHQALTELKNLSSNGMFINACGSHCQTIKQETWFGNSYVSKLHDNAIGEAVGQWFHSDITSRKVDHKHGQWFHSDITFRKVDHKHNSPLVCEYNPEEPHWNNHYIFRGKDQVFPNFTLDDEINRRSELVPQCPADVSVYHHQMHHVLL